MNSATPRFSVRIVIPRNPSVFSLDHVSRFVTEDRQTAPKYYDIWVSLYNNAYQGFENESSDPVVLANNCYYDLQGEQTQFCYSQYTVTIMNLFEYRDPQFFQFSS